jgi:hypothetical protein
MAVETTTTTLGDALTKNVNVAFHEGYESVPVAGRSIFKMTNTGTKTSEHDSYSMDGFAKLTAENANYEQIDPVKGDNLILTQRKMTAEREVTKEAGMYDQYDIMQVGRSAQHVGMTLAKRIELDLQKQIGEGFGTSYTDIDGTTISTTSADGLAIFSALHTVNGSADTYSNLGTAAFGQTGLEELEELFVGFLNHSGELVDRVPTAIFTTDNPTVVNLVREYNKGMNHIQDSNRGINVYQNRYDHVVMKYLDTDSNGQKDASKKNHWGLVDLSNNDNLIFEVSQSPIVYDPYIKQGNRNLVIQGDTHYSLGVLDASCIAGSNA